MGVILLIIILGIVVIVHEGGHFLIAKKFGIRVDEFGIGFPPRAKTLGKKNGTTYTLNWIPFGGFVKILGENPEDAPKGSPHYAQSMAAKPRYVQALVLAGGVLFNFLLAWLLISIGYMSGFPSSVDTTDTVQNAHVTITSISPSSPALSVGLKPGDVIYSIDGVATNAASISAVQTYIQAHGSKNINLEVQRGKQKIDVQVVPKQGLLEGKAGIGVGLDLVGTVRLNPVSAVIRGFSTTVSMAKNVAVHFAQFIAGLFNGHKSNLDGLTGPVGIAGIAGDAFRLGFAYLISFTAIISVNLAVLNLIPFPALDGGRLFFLLLEAIRGKKISSKVLTWVNTAGFALLILLMLVVTYHDIVKLF